jgi:hypothetical protein
VAWVGMPRAKALPAILLSAMAAAPLGVVVHVGGVILKLHPHCRRFFG